MLKMVFCKKARFLYIMKQEVLANIMEIQIETVQTVNLISQLTDLNAEILQVMILV